MINLNTVYIFMPKILEIAIIIKEQSLVCTNLRIWTVVSGESKVKGRVLLTSMKIYQAIIGSKHDIAEICCCSVWCLIDLITVIVQWLENRHPQEKICPFLYEMTPKTVVFPRVKYDGLTDSLFSTACMHYSMQTHQLILGNSPVIHDEVH